MPKFTQSAKQTRKGGKPIPTALKVLHGNPGQRKLNTNEPKPMKGIPEPPSSLCDLARKEWDEIAPGLMQMGVLTKVDKAILTAYCQAYGDYTRAREGLNEMRKAMVEGHSSGIFVSPTKYDGFKKSPLIAIANEASLLMIKFAA